MRIGNWRIRRNGRKINLFDMVKEIREDLKALVPELSPDGKPIPNDVLIPLLSKIRTYYRHKKKGVPVGRKGSKGYRDLTKVEHVIFDYMIRTKLNPCTTYRWFIASRLPEDLMEQLKEGNLSQKMAMKLSAARKKDKDSAVGLYIMEQVRSIVRKMDWI
jgi:hypothetical protein